MAARRARRLRSPATDEELAKTLVHTLEPVVGADHVRASVHVEYDLGTSEDTQETLRSQDARNLNSGALRRKFDGGATAGVPGTASNVPRRMQHRPLRLPPLKRRLPALPATELREALGRWPGSASSNQTHAQIQPPTR